MNDIVEYRTTTASAGTLVVVGLTAAMAVGHDAWPTHETPAYQVEHANSSYSPFIQDSLMFTTIFTQSNFVKEIAEIYATLSEGQEPLGSEFEEIWDANVDILYES